MNFTKSIILAILSNFIWGTTFLASKLLISELPASSILTLRFLIASIALFFYGCIKKNNFQLNLFLKNWKFFTIYSVISYLLMYWFQLESLKYISSSQNAGIMLLAPIFTMLVSAITSARIDTEDLISILVAFVGAFLIVSPNSLFNQNSENIIGIIFALISSFCLGLSINLTKHFFSKQISTTISIFNLTFYSILISTLGFSVLSIFSTSPLAFTYSDWHIWGALLYLGLICSVIAFVMWNYSIKYLSPFSTALAMYIKTPVAYLMGFIFLNENLNPAFYFGTVIIILSIFANFYYKSMRG